MYRSFTHAGVVAERMKTLENTFKELQERLVSELPEKGISGNAVLRSLSLMPIRMRLEYAEDVRSVLAELQREKNVENLLIQLNSFSTFIDYSLPEYITSEFGSPELKRDMSSYAESVRAFMRDTKVGDLIDIKWPGRQVSSDGFSKLWVKVRRDAKSYTLEKLNDLRTQLCADLKVSEILSSIVSLTPAGSFFAVWAIRETVTDEKDRMIQVENYEKYEREGIEMIMWNDKLLYLRQTESLRKV